MRKAVVAVDRPEKIPLKIFPLFFSSSRVFFLTFFLLPGILNICSVMECFGETWVKPWREQAAMRRIARITGIYALDGRTGERVPLVQSFVPAGFPSPADDYVEKDLDLNEYLVGNPAATFFVRVAGDSMIDAGIHHGDILIVDRSLDAEPGRVVIAVVEGEMLVKRLRRLRGRLALLSENENYPPVEIREGVELAVWGVVTYVIHPL